MRNPYQLTGYTAKGNGTLLGTFDTHSEAVAEARARQTDKNNFFIEFRISRKYQYQINCFNCMGALLKCAVYRTKEELEKALTPLKGQYHHVDVLLIGGLGDE